MVQVNQDGTAEPETQGQGRGTFLPPQGCTCCPRVEPAFESPRDPSVLLTPPGPWAECWPRLAGLHLSAPLSRVWLHRLPARFFVPLLADGGRRLPTVGHRCTCALGAWLTAGSRWESLVPPGSFVSCLYLRLWSHLIQTQCEVGGQGALPSSRRAGPSRCPCLARPCTALVCSLAAGLRWSRGLRLVFRVGLAAAALILTGF